MLGLLIKEWPRQGGSAWMVLEVLSSRIQTGSFGVISSSPSLCDRLSWF